MPNLKEVKNRINSVVSTQQITKAMKMVAASKLRKAQDGILKMRPYAEGLQKILLNVSSNENIDNPFLNNRPVHNVLLVVVTSDRGLCGAFNSNILKYTKSHITHKYSDLESSGNLEILPIGKKAYKYFKKNRYIMNDKWSHLLERLNFNDTCETVEEIMENFVNKKYDKVEIIYNEFKNVATQINTIKQLLPIVHTKDDIATGHNNNKISWDYDYIYEPSQSYIYQVLIPKSLKIQFYKAILESNASEQGARMTAMDKASENADELLKDLRLSYNRTRQAVITKEILEIVGGAEALSASGQ